MSNRKKRWIQGAGLKEGTFTAQAKRAGMGVQSFAKHVLTHQSKYSATTIKRARLAVTLKKIAKKK